MIGCQPVQIAIGSGFGQYAEGLIFAGPVVAQLIALIGNSAASNIRVNFFTGLLRLDHLRLRLDFGFRAAGFRLGFGDVFGPGPTEGALEP